MKILSRFLILVLLAGGGAAAGYHQSKNPEQNTLGDGVTHYEFSTPLLGPYLFQVGAVPTMADNQIDQSGHLPQMEQAAIFNQRMLAYLTAHPS